MVQTCTKSALPILLRAIYLNGKTTFEYYTSDSYSRACDALAAAVRIIENDEDADDFEKPAAQLISSFVTWEEKQFINFEYYYVRPCGSDAYTADGQAGIGALEIPEFVLTDDGWQMDFLLLTDG